MFDDDYKTEKKSEAKIQRKNAMHFIYIYVVCVGRIMETFPTVVEIKEATRQDKTVRAR